MSAAGRNLTLASLTLPGRCYCGSRHCSGGRRTKAAVRSELQARNHALPEARAPLFVVCRPYMKIVRCGFVLLRALMNSMRFASLV
jgi:hypothetical protein